MGNGGTNERNGGRNNLVSEAPSVTDLALCEASAACQFMLTFRWRHLAVVHGTTADHSRLTVI